jgi:hypothetical protein
MSRGPRCELCGGAIEEPRDTWRQVAGWVKPPGGKGSTAVVKAVPTGKVAHSVCIVALRAKVSPEQGALL